MQRARLEEMISADPYARHLGFALADRNDAIAVEVSVAERHLNFLGVTHGGALFSLADCAFSLASNAAGDRAVAIDTHFVITGASKVGDVLTAVAEQTTRGKTLGTYRITVSRSDGRIVGLFTGTVHISTP